jgi:hypothetical protein
MVVAHIFTIFLQGKFFPSAKKETNSKNLADSHESNLKKKKGFDPK